ncbi:MAG: hypothetical protein JJ969_13130 [Rhizobiaceae bacterium]|nr:hypothetical protein [Rhizobiaceae bacterium]
MPEDKAFARDMTMADKFWEEFTYRHELFWSLLSKCILVHTFLISTPLFPSSDPISLWISIPFLIVALMFAVLSYRILQSEASRMAGPATLHRELLMRHVSEPDTAKYMISKFPKEKFIVTMGDINDAFPFTRFLNLFGMARLSISTEKISKAKIAQIVPIIWFTYGFLAPLIIALGLWLSTR